MKSFSQFIREDTSTVVSTFTTEKGSRYIHYADGTTVRDKMARPEHGADAGIKPRSAHTYYVAPKDLPTLDALQLRPAPGVRMVLRARPDGTLGILYSGPKGSGWMNHHRTLGFPRFSPVPVVGMMPIEVWDDGSTHFGNRIVQVTPA